MIRRITAVMLTVSLLFSFAVIFASAEAPELGDVNGDGKITASDARSTLRASAKLEELTEEQLKVADVDFNGRVSAADARIILRVSAKLEEFKAEETTTDETTTAEATTKAPETTTKAPETTTKAPETTTKKEETTLPDLDEGVEVDVYPAAIDAFFSGNFYLNGTMVDGKNSTPLKMATGKSQTEIAVMIPDSNLNVSIYAKGKETYLKLSSGDKKHYVELTDLLKDEMNIDFSEIMGQLTSIKFNDAGKPVLTHGIYDGMECDIYTFANDEGVAIKFYAIEDKIVQLTLSDAESVESAIAITELTSKIPSNMLTLKGYSKTSVLFLPTLYPEFSGSI